MHFLYFVCIFLLQKVEKVTVVDEEEMEESLKCSKVKINQLYVPGQPKRLLIVGFPKSGAIWLKESLDNLFPYYYSLVSEEVVKVLCP